MDADDARMQMLANAKAELDRLPKPARMEAIALAKELMRPRFAELHAALTDLSAKAIAYRDVSLEGERAMTAVADALDDLCCGSGPGVVELLKNYNQVEKRATEAEAAFMKAFERMSAVGFDKALLELCR